jgi:ribonuclease J
VPEKTQSDSELVFLPLGGAGEIGMNLYLYGFGPARNRKWLMIDLGITFGDLRHPGIDTILPDISFIEELRDDLVGIIITHAHEDHYGAVQTLWPQLRAPVSATKFVIEMLVPRLAYNGLDEELTINEIKPGEVVDLAPFSIELISVAHSLPEPNAVVIKTKAGTIIHSGDWKFDDEPVIGEGVNIARLRELGEEGVRALICDSTNVLRQGRSPSEGDVARSLTDIVKSAKKRVAITGFASNVARIHSIAKAAEAAGRHVVAVGRSMHRVTAAAKACGYLKDIAPFIAEEHCGSLPRDKTLILCTGSQGEARAALGRIASDQHPEVTLNKGDLVIFSSRTIPGNEKAVGQVYNDLAALGCDIIVDGDALVHVTGHPRRDELKQLYDLVKPDILIPMHGEMRHLVEHARFARHSGIKQSLVVLNGEMAHLGPNELRIIDEVPSGRMHIDGLLQVPGYDGPAHQRRRLGFAGIVTVSLVVEASGHLIADPAIIAHGLPECDDHDELFEDIIETAVHDGWGRLSKREKRDDEALAEGIRRQIRRNVSQAWGKKPVCYVNVSRL